MPLKENRLMNWSSQATRRLTRELMKLHFRTSNTARAKRRKVAGITTILQTKNHKGNCLKQNKVMGNVLIVADTEVVTLCQSKLRALFFTGRRAVSGG